MGYGPFGPAPQGAKPPHWGYVLAIFASIILGAVTGSGSIVGIGVGGTFLWAILADVFKPLCKNPGE